MDAQSNSLILESVRRLAEVYHPKAVYLFGSYAWGEPNPDSDMDFLVVVKSSGEKSYRRPLKGIDALWGFGGSKDIVVYTEDEFISKSADKTSLTYKIKTSGKKLYEAL